MKRHQDLEAGGDEKLTIKFMWPYLTILSGTIIITAMNIVTVSSRMCYWWVWHLLRLSLSSLSFCYCCCLGEEEGSSHALVRPALVSAVHSTHKLLVRGSYNTLCLIFVCRVSRSISFVTLTSIH